MTEKIGEERIVITFPPELKKAMVKVGINRGTNMSEAVRHSCEINPEVKAFMSASGMTDESIKNVLKMEAKDE
jgi:hypothetical protein